MDSRFTGLIRIISTPSGDAPTWVKEAWVGMELPCFYQKCSVQPGDHQEVSGKKVTTPKVGYLVQQNDALHKLKDINQEACDWWKSNGYPKGKGLCFVFEAECVEIVSGIRQGVHVPEFVEFSDHDGDSER